MPSWLIDNSLFSVNDKQESTTDSFIITLRIGSSGTGSTENTGVTDHFNLRRLKIKNQGGSNSPRVN